MTEPPNDSTPPSPESDPQQPTPPPAPGQQPPQYGSPQYGEPRYGSPQYGEPQYGSPQYGSPQYGSPQYGAPGQPTPPQQPGTPPGPQQQPPQYGTPQYGEPQYGTPQYGAPQYGTPEYGAPAPGSVPPGSVPPPPPYQGAPAPGYGAAQLPPDTFSVGESFGWAWNQFKANPGPMILPGVLMLIVAVLAAVLGATATSWAGTSTTETYSNPYGADLTYTTTSFGVGATILLIIVEILVYLVAIYIQASIVSGAVRVANGEPVSAKSFLVPIRFGPVLATAILVGIITGIGYALCVIPGIIAIFFLQFAVLVTISESLSPGKAMGRSVDVTKNRVSDSILTLLVTWATMLVGAIVCGIGLIVAAPLAGLFQVHAFRRIVGEPVVPAPGPAAPPAAGIQ
ncbi:hypothetical protein [Gordonia sp. NPDC003429]